MKAISPAEQAVLDRAGDAPMLDQVLRWSAINSGSRNLSGLADMAGQLGDAFAGLPGELRLIQPDPVDAVLPDGRVTPVAHGAHLLVSVRPDAPARMLLTGHMDTVFAADHPFQRPGVVDAGLLGGPGVADMKGGIALMLSAVMAFETSPGAAGLGYDVVINSDEEVGSPSSAALLRAVSAGKLAAFTYEPALPDGTLAGARPGSGNFSMIVTGRSAHAGRNPEDGRNALLAAADLALRLKAGSGGGFTCNPARIDGGGPNNMVPGHAILRVNFRPQRAADEAAARQLITASIAAVESDHDVGIQLHGEFGRPPKPVDPGAERLFALVGRCGADLGLTIARRDTGGVCDGNNIAACGIPVVDTMGARGGAIHSDQEFLVVDSLAERARLSALAMLRIAAGQRA
ncbi:MAG: hydrolase [Sphingobium sp.]